MVLMFALVLIFVLMFAMVLMLALCRHCRLHVTGPGCDGGHALLIPQARGGGRTPGGEQSVQDHIYVFSYHAPRSGAPCAQVHAPAYCGHNWQRWQGNGQRHTACYSGQGELVRRGGMNRMCSHCVLGCVLGWAHHNPLPDCVWLARE